MTIESPPPAITEKGEAFRSSSHRDQKWIEAKTTTALTNPRWLRDPANMLGGTAGW